MKRAGFVLALVAIFCSPLVARAARLQGHVYLQPINSEFTSDGYALFLNDLSQPDSAAMSGEHDVRGPQVFEHPVTGNGTYSYQLQGPAAAGACYGTTLHVIADPQRAGVSTLEETWNGDTRCAPKDDGLPDKDLPDDGGDNSTPHPSISRRF